MATDTAEKNRLCCNRYYTKNRDRLNLQKREWRAQHRDEVNAQYKVYREKNKDKLLAWHKKWNHEHPESVLKSRRKYALRIHIEVLSHYSDGTPICSHCREKDIRVLCLDHINGGGNKHRREIGKRGTSYWNWLKLNGFPTGFQVLCWNCNARKEYGGQYDGYL